MCLNFAKSYTHKDGVVCDILLDGQLQTYLTKNEFLKIKELMKNDWKLGV